MVITRDSAFGKELARWDTPRNQPVTDSSGEPIRNPDGTVMMGMNCVGYEEFPKMLYKAQVNPFTGQPAVSFVPAMPWGMSPAEYEQKCAAAEQFTRSCQKVVHNADQEGIAKGQGWCVMQKDALDLYEKQQQEFAELAARAAYDAQAMSAKAQAEFAKAEDASEHHVVDVVGGKKGPKAIAPQDKSGPA
jgi:hypothetical protein